MPTKTKRRRTDASPTGVPAQLRQIIRERDLSAYEVARSAGVAPSVVSRFLARRRGLTLDTFDAIATALGLKLVESARGRRRPARPATPRPAAPNPGGRAVEPESAPDPC